MAKEQQAFAGGARERGHKRFLIQVTGDLLIDWLIATRGTGEQKTVANMYDSAASCGLAAQPGGAFLLESILQVLAAQHNGKGPRAGVQGPRLPREALAAALANPMRADFQRTFSYISRFDNPDGDAQCHAWRIKEFLGEAGAEAAPRVEPGEGADVLVIEDDNRGFRRGRKGWPRALDAERAAPEQIVLKLAWPLPGSDSAEEESALWQRLRQRPYRDGLTVVTAIDDLRRGPYLVGESRSWEQITGEIAQAVCGDDELSRAARVVVVIDTAGAVLVEPGHGRCVLVLDTSSQESDWNRRYPGKMLGYSACMTAALAFQAASARPDWPLALCQGMQAIRALHHDGYQVEDEDGGKSASFPLQAVAQALAAVGKGLDFKAVELKLEDRAPGWSLLDLLVRDKEKAARAWVIKEQAHAMSHVPRERVGDWQSVDRQEIESVRSVCNIIREYVRAYQSGKWPANPLCLAVFGPPGAGKSSSLKQVADGLFPGFFAKLEFNLSQFRSADELPLAFHKVRDLVLAQKLPLVIWDEFDMPLDQRPLGWLHHFLAPMNDGQFLRQTESHPIGPAIFIFAGGTCASMAEFRRDEQSEENKQAKLPDFVSRLRAFIDVTGPNPADEVDRGYMLRRALIMRKCLWGYEALRRDDRLQVDEGLLHAFLAIDRYKHGKRSVEAIIEMSSLANKVRYDRSCLPAPHQLALHVDPEQFLALLNQKQ